MMAEKKPLQEFIQDSAYKTFEVTCYMFPVEAAELEDMGIDTDVEESDMVTSVVTFQGASTGAMFISVNDDLYDALAANMLGENTVADEEREAALCEIANIVCGNIVPYFAANDEICKINPPKISNLEEKEEYENSEYGDEKLRLFVDEGIADISLYFTKP